MCIIILDARDYIYFKLLAHKMPPTVKVPIRDNDNKKKKLYKPSIVESQNAFILHVTVGTFNQIMLISEFVLN
jgi:hypothetical protein